MTQRAVAKALDLSVRSVADLVLRGMPRHRDGRRWGYDVGECKRWYRARKRAEKAARRKGKKPRTELEKARLQKAVALTTKREKELRRMRETTLPAEVAADLAAEAGDTLREAAQPLPAAWATRCTNLPDRPEAVKVLHAFRDELTTTLRGAATASAREPEEQSDPPETLDDARARRWTADAELIELRAKLEDGRYVTLESLGEEVRDVLYRVRSRVMGLPDRFASELVGIQRAPAARRILERAVAEALAPLDATPPADD